MAAIARDAFIAGHAGRNDLLVTTNEADFLDLGVPPERLRVAARG